MDFDLLLFLKEMQLQHGLRAEDYGRYRRYATNRLSTLRHQLGLVQNSKKFQQKEVTPHNATKPEHLQLLILCAERCWAAAEDMLEKRRTAAGDTAADNKVPGGMPPSNQFRKRLNKSVKWVTKLQAVAKAVAGERLKQELEAYVAEVKGRAAVAHGLMMEAKKHFLEARERYYALKIDSNVEQWALLVTKLTEMDDRVLYCMLQLDEDVSTYKPSSVFADDLGKVAGTTIEWNNRQLNVASIKVRDALRGARALNVEATKAKALEQNCPIPIGQQNKTLDLMDRRIACLNDALAHARKDLRVQTDSNHKTELQLLVHYLIFQVSYETLQRILFMVEVHVRRFQATEKCLKGEDLSRNVSCENVAASSGNGGKGKKDIQPSQYASPLEIVRLYDAALETVGEMELLPGVDCRADLKEFSAVCRAGKLLYLGESWRVCSEHARAQGCYKASLFVLNSTAPTTQVEALRLVVEKSSIRLAASALLSAHSREEAGASSSEKRMGSPSSLEYLVDAVEEVAVANNIIKFPPDYQAVPCKPIFVDIASAYVDYPASDVLGQPSSQRDEAESSSGEVKEESRWKWSWGWRK
ncbi:hypothetical protein TRVL_03445 [Trypanosoma vivax]|nr:hypothetical protein TRVL_03445 [Trypanosoma vivax]